MEAHLYSSFYAEGLIGSAHSFCWWHSSSNLSDQICHHRRHHIVAYADIHVTLAKKQKVCSILSRVLSMNILRNKFCSGRVLVFWGFNLVFFRSSLHTPQNRWGLLWIHCLYTLYLSIVVYGDIILV